MSIIGLESATSGGSALVTSPTKIMGKDDFLNLLITQLQYQDPLNPTDSTEFTAQLAQFSALEQMGNMNDNLQKLQMYQASINNAQAVSFIGKAITARGNTLTLTEGTPVDCRFELAQDASAVAVTIYDTAGEFVKAFESEALPAGRQVLAWDGRDKNGNPVPDGSYQFEVLAVDGNDERVDATPLCRGVVTGITFENNTTYLIAGDRRFAVGDVIDIAEAAAQSQTKLKNYQQFGISKINGGR
ncbi:MAG: flagellar hook assembly protein FlgD [Desulfobacterales bacterium]|nr:MAG: flagellar hook assembly protein FlgD [Desulfobacterales bacterium]